VAKPVKILGVDDEADFEALIGPEQRNSPPGAAVSGNRVEPRIKFINHM
jgi:hypothetical protein